MSKINLLDCTLRDGGYINNWHFGRDVISKICEKLSAAKIDIIEAGFLTNMSHTENDSLYSNCAEIDAVTEQCVKSTSRTAAMIAIGEMEMDPVSLLPAKNSVLDIVRITFHNNEAEIEKAFSYARCLMKKGYHVCMQPVGTTSYTDKELLGLIAEINLLSPYAFYLVDTLGILHHKELLHFIDLIDHNLKPEIKLGFHSHNNLQMSYSNAQFISEYSTAREFILDCSVYGMGRGAGNLCTELVAQYQNSKTADRYEMMPIYAVLDDYIYPIFAHTKWGYNAHYYIAAIHRCHPNYASFLMNKQTLTMNGVDLLLKSIPQEERYIYNKQRIEELYYSFQNHNIDDAKACSVLRDRFGEKNVLLLAPGKSLAAHQEQIHRFIEDVSPVIISINSVFQGFSCNYIFVSNLKRLYTLDMEQLNLPVICTSNLPNIFQNGIYVDYSTLCDQSNEELDNSGVMLIRLMKRIGVGRVYIAGFDGFSKEPRDNYFDEKMVNSVTPESADRKNESITRQLQVIMREMDIVSLTPSRYFETQL